MFQSRSSRKSLEDYEVERRVFVGRVLNGLWLRTNSCHEIDPWPMQIIAPMRAVFLQFN
jgi:hypothetical protein